MNKYVNNIGTFNKNNITCLVKTGKSLDTIILFVKNEEPRIFNAIYQSIKLKKSELTFGLLTKYSGLSTYYTLLLLETCIEENNLESFVFLIGFLMKKLVDDEPLFIFDYILHLIYNRPFFFIFFTRTCRGISQKYIERKQGVFSDLIKLILYNNVLQTTG